MVSVERVLDRVYSLKDGFDSFSYLITGSNKALLFDTGCGVDDIKTTVDGITDLPLLVIASHGHFDHVGGSRFFSKVYLSSKDRNILEIYDERLLARWYKEMREINGSDGSLERTGVEASFGNALWMQIADLDFCEFDLGDIHGEIMELPGHSSGSVGVLIPELKLLLAGDALSPVMCLIFKNHGTVAEELETVRKALRMEFDHFLTGHSGKLMTKDILLRMEDCLKNANGKRFLRYSYPKPPYGEGFFNVHSLEDEPVGLIIENKSL